MDSPILTQLRQLLIEREKEIEAWFAGAFRSTEPFFYTSMDIRHSGFKIAPVDTNLFPGGFNNLSETSREKAAHLAKDYFKRYYPGLNRLLLIPENHTRNAYYLENLAILKRILEEAGVEVRLGSLSAEHEDGMELISLSGQVLRYQALTKQKGRLATSDGFVPEFILVNNDLTDGAPEALIEIEQPVMPPVGFGWYRRRKTSHFDTYNTLARDFAQSFDFDPWLISTVFARCGVVNFKEHKGLECVALAVEKALFRIRQKYEEYGV